MRAIAFFVSTKSYLSPAAEPPGPTFIAGPAVGLRNFQVQHNTLSSFGARRHSSATGSDLFRIRKTAPPAGFEPATPALGKQCSIP